MMYGVNRVKYIEKTFVKYNKQMGHGKYKRNICFKIKYILI